jgi:secreted trypsin-like serine protease
VTPQPPEQPSVEPVVIEAEEGENNQGGDEDDDGENNLKCGVGRYFPVARNPNGLVEEEVKRIENKNDLRVAGGWAADKNEWPWIVALFNRGRQFCGGSIISQTHILTAAHCVSHMNSQDVQSLTVRLGDHDLNDPSDTRSVDKKVKLVIKNKKFSMQTLHHDVAILVLAEPITFTKTIKRVCLPSGNNYYDGELVTAAGWGLLKENGQRPPVLQEITFEVWNQQKCETIYQGNAPGGITKEMLCAGQRSKDSCSGDSGGPLVHAQPNGQWEQVGIVSWGIGCGKEDFPGVYARVTELRSWIDKVMANY